MRLENIQEAILLLEDGKYFKGIAAGEIGTTHGEICFNTGMTGYQEVFTDPSYYGQLIVMTNVHIGNYGVRDEDIESDSMKISGLITRNYTVPYSRKMANKDIQNYFEFEGMVGISGVDTRAVVRYIRSKGAMNAIISSETTNVEDLMKKFDEIPSMEGLELASKVSTDTPYYFGDEKSPLRVAVLDYGVKRNILRCMAKRGCYMKVFPAKTPMKEVLNWKADGVFLSNGPGDPASMDYAIKDVQYLLKQDIPTFGICLGHQILSLALGYKTFKMHHGHRGLNHPVENQLTGLCEITSQNHGFCVSLEDAQKDSEVEITYKNLNDNTLEGIRLLNKRAFSVQFHPEAAAGPHDSRYLFDEFVNLMKGKEIFVEKNQVVESV
tara:strand:- start:175 stop:1317 length:1143 start_codon:yes stop_codon:yes gene_type:complete